MHLIVFVLSGPAPPAAPAPTEQELLTALWGAARPADGIEHIRVHPSRAGARGVAFCLADDAGRATGRVRALCERALHTSDLLHGWHLTEPPDRLPH
ncbi:hypothetical protein [Streptomyces sp. NPDC089919]|uniref:hypothetical protein n=1 Tax=Streptomyces sp. NPDC089919 TaxID=3155188 RepID=UPI0034346E40